MHQQQLYCTLLADVWSQLPTSIANLHWVEGHKTVTGLAQVQRGTHWLVRPIAWLFGFPAAGNQQQVSIQFSQHGNIQHWQRSFAGKRYNTQQMKGTGRNTHLLVERFGPLAFAMALVFDPTLQQLQLHIKRWTLGGIPLPLWLKPRIKAYEFEDNQQRFNFYVHISLPIMGKVVEYTGWLE